MKRLKRFIRTLQEYVHTDIIKVEDWKAAVSVYQGPGRYEACGKELGTVSEGDRLVSPGETVFLDKDLLLPDSWREKKVELLFATSGEGMLRLNGVPYHGLDRNRGVIPLPADNVREGKVHLRIELMNPNSLPRDDMNFDDPPPEFIPKDLYLIQSRIAIPNKPLRSLIYTLEVYLSAAAQLPEGDLLRERIVKAMYQVLNAYGAGETGKFQDAQFAQKQEEILLGVLRETVGGKSAGTMHMIGQSHIDVAWLWPLKETMRKCSRTFSTVCTMLDEDSNYLFTQSQPQLYEYTKQHYPELYEKIKKHIREGRWEVVGGMWIEPDLNIPSGESLVRQLLYGMRFYGEEFGVKPRVEWMPDTFGYCASLPQLLKQAGIDYFMTTKMWWNDTNRFPYDLFHWKGIDGTPILTYINHGLNEIVDPENIKNHWDHWYSKSAHEEQMLLYGYGDGGGGVTREMVEIIHRSADLPGLPSCRFSTAHAFLDGIAARNPQLPSWFGEMYLERHRGTYTTHAKNKKLNRKAEVLYREIECWSSLAWLWCGLTYPKAELDGSWKLILLNQFHDIIPGSSIPEVYVDSAVDYRTVFESGEVLKQRAFEALTHNVATVGDGTPYVLFNGLSWNRSDVVTIQGGVELEDAAFYDEQGNELKSDLLERGLTSTVCVYVPNIPQMGYKTIWLRKKPTALLQEVRFDGRWDNKHYDLIFDEKGRIVSWFDKMYDRELLQQGEKGNEFRLYHDLPLDSDAWDIDPRYADQPAAQAELIVPITARRGNTRDILRFEWQIGRSHIVQEMHLFRHSRRVDFVTKVEWNEEHKLLNVAFPVDVLAPKATYEIPFGAVERSSHNNTSWDAAQYEVCGHRWADLSEGDYGISLLNDCKYGYSVKDGVMQLSLLRAPKWPDPTADLGNHEFVYSIYPHEDDWKNGETVKQGFMLNHPVEAVRAEAHEGTWPSVHSLVQLDSKHTVLDTVKLAEDGAGIVIRLYEAHGARENVRIGVPGKHPVQSQLVTILEEEIGIPSQSEAMGIDFKIKPYQVQTVKFLF
jgi:alpha-mannosidase